MRKILEQFILRFEREPKNDPELSRFHKLYEKKGKDAVFYKAYAKLLFSTNEMPQNLEDKSDAFYRRLLVLDMNHQENRV